MLEQGDISTCQKVLQAKYENHPQHERYSGSYEYALKAIVPLLKERNQQIMYRSQELSSQQRMQLAMQKYMNMNQRPQQAPNAPAASVASRQQEKKKKKRKGKKKKKR